MSLPRLSPLLLALGMAYFPSVKYDVLIVDGPDTEFYGFPLPWNSRFIAGSLAKDIYLLPLALDAAFFLFLSWWLWKIAAPGLARMRPIARGSIVAGIWIYGLCSAGAILLTLTVLDLFPSLWYDLPVDKVFGVSLHGSV